MKYGFAALLLLFTVPLEAAPICPVLVLNGSSRYATSAATIYPNTNALVSFTAEAWIYPGTIPFDHNQQILLSDDAYDVALDYVPASGLVRIYVKFYGTTGVTSQALFDTRNVSLNAWHHVAASFDAVSMNVYICLDGNVGSPRAVAVSGFGSFTSNFLVGGFTTSGFFNGSMDQIRVSDVARYTSNFTPPASFTTDANTRALYFFNEPPTVSQFADSSGNNNTLTGIGGTVTGNGGSCTLGAAPTVSSIMPGSGAPAGGTAVTIGGTNFVNGATVAIGGVAATNVVVGSASSITATTGAHSAGTVNVVVTNGDQQSGTLTNGYAYSSPSPTVVAITPSSGTSAGGTSLSISGTNFANGATVSIGGAAATSVVVTNSSTITAMSGAHAAGIVNVVVTNSDLQSGTLTSGYRYYTASFTDDPLTTGSSAIRAVHITELRTRINALRMAHMLGTYSYADPSLAAGTPIRAVHITDLREALRQVYVAAMIAAPGYTDTTLNTQSTIVKAVHIAEIRSAIAAIE
jgi:hypothetical protein